MSLKGMEFDSFLHPPQKWSNYGLAMHFVIKLGWGFPANGLAAFSSSPVLLFMTEMGEVKTFEITLPSCGVEMFSACELSVQPAKVQAVRVTA